MFSAISSFRNKNCRALFLALRSNGPKGSHPGMAGYKKARCDGRANSYRKRGEARYNAATTIISTSTSGLYIFASTQARAGAAPGATQASQT